MLSKNEIKRYNRHIIMSEIGQKGQKKLKNSKVLVIGAGGLGCPVLQYISAAGVGTIGICDYDIVSESNLQRQILYSVDDIGKPKAEIAKKRLETNNPYIQFIIHNEKITKYNVFELIDNYDIIVDGSDNFSTRYMVGDACTIKKKPLVYGAIYKFEGQVSVFNYQNGPSYRCLFSEEPEKEAPTCSDIGVIGVLPGIIGSIQANETIKLCLGIGNILSGRLFVIDTLSFNFNIIKFEKTKFADNIKELGEYDFDCYSGSSKVKNISSIELKEMLLNNKAVDLIDIREKNDFESYHIKGSKNILKDILMNNTELINNTKKTVIICDLGITSAALIQYLESNFKLEDLYNLKGGIQAWLESDSVK